LISYVYFFTHNDLQGTASLAGLQGKVVIERDKYGIAHITAKSNDLDAFFALGYVHAQDRMWQLEFQRHVEQGTLSELFGSTTLPMDEFMRTVGFYKAAEQAWQGLDPQTKAIINAYTAGVNAFLSTGHLPLQFKLLHYRPKPWTVIDTIAWQKMIAFDLRNSYNMQWQNLLLLNKVDPGSLKAFRQSYPGDAPTTLTVNNLKQSRLLTAASQSLLIDSTAVLLTPLQSTKSIALLTNKENIFSDHSGQGSNAWVVDGHKTATGKPLLANDPHLTLSLPGIWYLAELRGPHLHVTGATIPGLPIIFIGHNEQIAWGITAATVEVADLYQLPADASLLMHHEFIKVRGKKAPVDYIVKQSAQGPIINAWLNPKPAPTFTHLITLKWTGLLPHDNSLQMFRKLNYAHNWTQFRAAAQDLGAPALNLLYADTAGNIGYQLAGNIPLRDKAVLNLPYTVLPATAPYIWQGLIPFSKLPYAFNPPQHELISANNKIVPDHYLYVLTRYWEAPPYRAMRIEKLLQEKDKLTISDMSVIQTDTLNTLWLFLKPYLLTQCQPLDKKSQTGLNLLRQWDGETTPNSIGATVFAYWYRALIQTINKPLNLIYWGQESLLIKQLASNEIYCPKPLSLCKNYLGQTLKQAMEQLIVDLGEQPKNWQWGKVHLAVFKEVGVGDIPGIGYLWNRTVTTSGGEETVNVGAPSLDNFTQKYGPSYRQIIDLSHLDNSQYIIPTGQIDDPFSAHHTDLMDYWRQGKYIKFNALSSDDKRFILLPK
jgi:penicillin amidase